MRELPPETIAVIDTETNWRDAVMSIGAVVADARDLSPVNARYFIIDPEYRVGGMFSAALHHSRDRAHAVLDRAEALARIGRMFDYYHVSRVFAYNARFDLGHLPELARFPWYDIMRVAAYRQTNPYIPEDAPCCASGKLRSGYGVEAIYRMLSGGSYTECHDALSDAVDELHIMRMLARELREYDIARING